MRNIASSLMVLLVAVLCAQPMSAMEISAEEASLYQQAGAEQDPAKKVALIESYIQKFPEGKWRTELVYSAALACDQLKQPDKVISFGEEVLKADPSNINILLILANTYSARPDGKDKSLAYSARCVAAIDKKALDPPPADVPEDQYKAELDKLKKSAQFTHDYVAGWRAMELKDYAAAEQPLKSAYSIKRNAKLALWLGVAYEKNGKIDDAISTLAEALVLLNGAQKDQVQKKLEQLYQQKHGSLDGLQKIIDDARGRIG
ncbi:MAG: hypothetical protein AB1714_28330 [Acidobacteriota bacterium]